MAVPSAPLRVLGIDPGTRVVGWGVVESDGPRIRPVAHGELRANPREASPARISSSCRGMRPRTSHSSVHSIVRPSRAHHSKRQTSRRRVISATGSAFTSAVESLSSRIVSSY